MFTLSVVENGMMREMHNVMAQGNNLVAQFYKERADVEGMNLFALFELYSDMINQCDDVIDNFTDVIHAYNNYKQKYNINECVVNMMETEFYEARGKVIDLLQYLERHQMYIDRVLDEYPRIK